MLRSAPAFWWRDRPGLAARLLGPMGALYGAVTAQRMRRPGLPLDVPVICVGNLVVGGAGKTPLVLEIARRLLARGERPAVLSRGYGRDAGGHGTLRVDPVRHKAANVGDEPLLLARVAPTYVSADRVRAAAAAMHDGATAILLDDGLQNPALAKLRTIAVVDGQAGIGNGLCVPAGPLRAPLAAQWPHVSALCLIGEGQRGETLATRARQRGCPVLRAALEPDAAYVAALQGRKLLAFAGIGRPAKFFDTLERCGLNVVATESFPDHHRFTAEEQRGLETRAAAEGAQLVTTEKDRVRLPPEFPARVLPVRLTLADPAGLDALLDAAIR